MFLEENIVEFVNKIINNSNEDENEIKNNLEKFCEYLSLTKMTEEDTIEWLNRVIICIPELISLKKKLKVIDVRSLVDYNEVIANNQINKPKKRNLTKNYNEKHYHHYETVSSSNCGGGSSTSTSRC